MKRAREKKVKPKAEKKYLSHESKQFLKLFLVLLLIFACFYIPYAWIYNQKYFTYNHILWSKDKEGDYHGQFKTFTDENNTHNIYLSYDPRENKVPVDGKLDSFTYGMILTFDRAFDQCKGAMARSSLYLADFLKSGVGSEGIITASSERDYALEKKIPYANCSSSQLAIVQLKMSSKSFIEKVKDDPDCYTISVSSCDDILPLEQFMSRAVNDFYEMQKAKANDK